MPALLSHPTSFGTKVLLFGSQALAFDEASAEQLRSTLFSTPELRFIIDTITDLPQHWVALSDAIPSLQDFHGAKLLEDLNGWLTTGKFNNADFPLANTLLTPLTVVTHLTQYISLLKHVQPESAEAHDFYASFKDNTETLGLCTGLLSAAAVSSSADVTQLHRYGAVAIRLAMAAGALVDAYDRSTEDSRSFSTAWNSPEIGTNMNQILKSYPNV